MIVRLKVKIQPATPSDELNLDVILDVPVTLSMEIGRTQINIRNLLQLNQGSVVELDRFAGEPLDVLVNGTLIAHGEVVVINDKFGIRLTDVISLSERVKRLSLMPLKSVLCWLLLLWFPVSLAMPAADIPKQTVRTVASSDIAAWGIGLLIVLGVFFLCVWGMRKLSGLTVSGTEKMRMVGGLSLGMREKVILLQVGKKQLILGVTPGRIETLHVLEGDDCLLGKKQCLHLQKPVLRKNYCTR